MITIISPDQYVICPWKNGKGETTELAINENGTLDDFDWRLSIAKVTEDGEFSNFEGYTRNLVLIKGNGIELKHNELTVDCLNELLAIATYDGGNCTSGFLNSGPISDLNLIVKSAKYRSSVETYTNIQTVILKPNHICLIYPLNSDLLISSRTNELKLNLPAGHLAQIEAQNFSELSVYGENFIIGYISRI